MFEWLFLLLPVAAASGWWLGRRSTLRQLKTESGSYSSSYYAGLDYLVNEQPDKAVEAFIHMLDVSPDSVETTLALGNLFRRRGEVDKAISIHQNLIARPTLTRKQRCRSLLELGQDYMSAGVYDRAESLFNELIEMGGEEKQVSQGHLITIYEREKDWDGAIEVAEQRQRLTGHYMGKQIAHYYCEQAEVAYECANFRDVMRYLKSALANDQTCVRASILQGKIEMSCERYKSALRALRQVQYQDDTFLPEVINDICACYVKLGQESTLASYLESLLNTSSGISVVLANAHRLTNQGASVEAAQFVTQYLQVYPSIRGLKHLVKHHLVRLGGGAVRTDLLILQDLIDQLLSQKPIYRCQVCGFSSKSLLWHCPSCHEWAEIKPIQGLEGE